MSDDEDTFLTGLRDMINEQLERRKHTPQKPFPDMTLVSWKNANGPHGPFRVADLENNKDNQPFLDLLETLKAHEGKMRVGNFFLWLFETGQAIGRKQVET